jgi:hypothetical protein
MREFLFSGIVFFTSSLWGFFGRIPFTTVESSRPFMDRAVGCAQLATAAYAIEQAYQNVSSTFVTNFTNPPIGTTIIIPDLDTRWNVTWKSPASASGSRTLIGHESFLFPPNWTTHASLPEPELAPEKYLFFENVVLVMLAMILALGIKQIFNYEVADLTNKMSALLTSPPAWVYNVIFNAVYASVNQTLHASIEGFGNHLTQIETSGSQLRNQVFGLGQDLNLLREELMTDRNEIRTAQIDIQTSVQKTVRDSIQDVVRDSIQSAVQTPIQNAIQTSIQPAVQTAMQNAVQSSISPVVQACIHNAVQHFLHHAIQTIQGTVQTCVENAVQDIATNTSECVIAAATQANDDVMMRMIDSLYENRQIIMNDSQTLRDDVDRMVNRLTGPLENLPGEIPKAVAEYFARSRSASGIGNTSRIPSSSNGAADNGANQNEETQETSHDSNHGDNNGEDGRNEEADRQEGRNEEAY